MSAPAAGDRARCPEDGCVVVFYAAGGGDPLWWHEGGGGLDHTPNGPGWRVDPLEAGAPARMCVEGCGLLAAPGDVYCDGCRSGVEVRRVAGAL